LEASSSMELQDALAAFATVDQLAPLTQVTDSEQTQQELLDG
jgi:hypothetical protein